MELTILACADLHVDDKVTLAGLTPRDPETGEPSVLADARRTLRWIGEVAKQEQVAAIFVAGDVFERPTPSPAAVAVVAEEFSRWCDYRPVYVLLGNHDRPKGDGVHALEPLRWVGRGNLRIIDRPDPFMLSIGYGIRVYPVPYPSASRLAAESASAEHTSAAVSNALDAIIAARAAKAVEARQRVQATRQTLDAARRAYDRLRRDYEETAAKGITLAERQADGARAARDGAARALAEASAAAARLPGMEAAEARAREAAAELDAITVEGKALAEQIAALPTDAALSNATAGVSACRAEVGRLERAASGRTAAEQAAARVPAAERQMDRAEQDLDEARAALGACAEDPSLAAAAAEARDLANDVQATVGAMRAVERERHGAVASARAHLASAERGLVAVEARLVEARAARAKAAEWEATAEACTVAPVLLIEHAVPAIEAEANRVLREISPRGMAVRLETQRALKSRDGMAETLDIIVRDDVGERPYEDFSGGEQFRLDLALRLGLARLLSQREGVPVDLLIIDEGGFGALDAEGLGALTEVVAGLQRLYSLVLIVTHIEAVAECLPTRIHVRAGENGSRVEVAA